MKKNGLYQMRQNENRSEIEVSASKTLTNSDIGSTYSIIGTSDVVISLPEAVVGANFKFRQDCGNTTAKLDLDPHGSLETIALPSTGVQQSGGKYIRHEGVGGLIEIECRETGVWTVLSYIGTWTAEA